MAGLCYEIHLQVNYCSKSIMMKKQCVYLKFQVSSKFVEHQTKFFLNFKQNQKLLVIRYKISMPSYDIVMTIVHQFMYPKICEFYQIHKNGCQGTLTKPQCVYLKYQFSSAMKSTFKLMPNE